MIFLFKSVRRLTFCAVKNIGLLAWSHANIQSIILAPLVLVLMLLPAVFESSDRRGRNRIAPTAAPQPTSYQSLEGPAPSQLAFPPSLRTGSR